jgi:transcriptional regulator with XRE-family HTH domain
LFVEGDYGPLRRVYNRWEHGAAIPQFDPVVRIAALLQVGLDELAGRSAAFSEPKITTLNYHLPQFVNDQCGSKWPPHDSGPFFKYRRDSKRVVHRNSQFQEGA